MVQTIDSPSKLLLDIKKEKFVSSEKLFRIRKNKNSPASDPSLKCQAKYDPETDQAIVFLNCKECSCDNKYIWLQKEKNSLYYWKPQ